MQQLNIGIVGACGRGSSFKAACDAHGAVTIRAVCDLDADQLTVTAQTLGASEYYTDYEIMLEKAQLDAVVVATPMHFHVSQSIAALQRGIHVLSEVPSGVSVEECRQLVKAVHDTKSLYMMAENYTYTKENVLIRELVQRGLFGVLYYAEGEYLHELKELNERTPWRRRWQTGINGITYGTHSLGPILQWMPHDRVVAVSCSGSGHHHRDLRKVPYENEDSVVMLCRMSSGGLVKVRVDMLSDRPHAMTNYQLQGTDGCYESARAHGEKNRIWLKSRSEDFSKWMDLEDLEKEFLPDMWRNAPEAATQAGHGGGDYFEIVDFIDAINGKRPVSIDIHAAMDMTLPGLISQQSIAENGRWIEVPDSRTWVNGNDTPQPQLMMTWPMHKPPPEPRLPTGYVLRCWEPFDEGHYLALMDKAGFKEWTSSKLKENLQHVLPNGLFVIEHVATHNLVATALANHRPIEQMPHGGELGWVAGDPLHKGKGLGLAVCAAATALLIRRGYQNIYLKTDDWRLPAIRTYLKLGYEPLVPDETMAERWKNVHQRLCPA